MVVQTGGVLPLLRCKLKKSSLSRLGSSKSRCKQRRQTEKGTRACLDSPSFV